MVSALAGQHALVSGGGRGIGRAIASALRQAGARVSIIGRSDDILQQAVLTGAADAAHAVDVTDEAAVRETMAGLSAGSPSTSSSPMPARPRAPASSAAMPSCSGAWSRST